MGELEHLAERKTASVDYGSMVVGIEEQVAVPGSERNYAEIDLESGAVGDGFLLSDKLCKLLFEFKMDVQGAVEET